MASETPADFIFIKEGQLVPKGPYTKLEVLGWYNTSSLDDCNLLFAFVTAGEEPTLRTKFHTLGALIKYNNAKDPFLHKPTSNESNGGWRMEELREALKRSKVPSTQPPPTSSSSAADVKIAYKNEDNQTKVTSKDNVLRFYKNKHFKDRDVRFAFLTGDEQPTEQTEFHTLAALIKYNDDRDPFARKLITKKKMKQMVVQLSDELHEALEKSEGLLTQPALTSISSAADVWIYYKDEEDWFHGPYMEHEVLDRYRNKRELLKDSFPFYVMTGDERPNLHTKSRTLGEVITSINSPFSVSAMANGELIAGIKYLFNPCIERKRWKRTVRGYVKDSSPPTTSYAAPPAALSPPPTSSSSAPPAAPAMANAVAAAIVATQSEENSEDQTGEEDYEGDIEDGEDEDIEEEVIEEEEIEDEDRKRARLANEWATYYLDVLEAYKTDDWNRVNLGVNNPILASMSPEIVSDTTFRKACCSALLGMLINLDYAYCKECHSVFHNYKQMVMHVNVKHRKKPDVLHKQMRAVNKMMKQICESWLKLSKEAEDKHTKEVIGKHRGVFFASQALRPEKSFVDYLDRQYDRAFYDYADNIDLITLEQIVDNKNFAPMIAKMIPRLKKEDNRIVSKIVRELDAHIGTNKTRCLQCKLVTGTKEQYYQHMRTFNHIQKANGMDLITLVVNMYKDEK